MTSTPAYNEDGSVYSAGKMKTSMTNTYIKNRGFKVIPAHYIVDASWGVVSVEDDTTIVWAIHRTGNQDGNRYGIHIETVGELRHNDATPEQYVAIDRLIKELKLKYPSIIAIKGHRDFQNKDCPWKLKVESFTLK